jgi:hypothetical protein
MLFFSFLAASFFFRRFRRRRAPLDSELDEEERDGLRRRRLRFFSSFFFGLALGDRDRFCFASVFFLASEGLRERDDDDDREDDEDGRDRRDLDGDGVGKSRFNVRKSGSRPIRDMSTADTFRPSSGPSRNTHRCAGLDRVRILPAAIGSRRYELTKRSTATRSSPASFSRCLRRSSDRPLL